MNGNDKQTPTGPGALKSIELMHSSSPQTPTMHLLGRDGGLRRTLSCGTEWPTSIAKRRKIQHSSSHGEQNVILAAQDDAGDGRSTTKISRVSFLVDMVQETLAKPVDKVNVRGPSSSSPFPDTGSFDADRASPSLQRLQAQAVEREVSPTGGKGLRKHLSSCQQSQEAPDPKPDDKESSSDFGDDDIDFELLNTVDANIISTNGMGPDVRDTDISELFIGDNDGDEDPSFARTSPKSASGGFGGAGNERPAARETQDLGAAGSVHCLLGQTLGQPIEQASDVQTGEESDEFGDDGSDILAADLEDVVAMYDSMQPQNDHGPTDSMSEDKTNTLSKVVELAVSSRADVGTTELVEISSNDEFGEDLDFEQIAVEYASATQGLQSTAPGANSVRTTYLESHI